MDEIEVIARAIRQEERESLYRSAEHLRFAFRDRAKCIVCGAELQGGRCPWSRVGATPTADGRTYCGWPKPAPTSRPAYHYNTRRR